MDIASILSNFSNPVVSPSYPPGPWRYSDMSQIVVIYESDPDAIRAVLPEPLQPAPGNRVIIEWRDMTDVTGFGPYVECGQSVACTLDGEPVTYVLQAYLDSEPPTLAGREILGFPKKHGEVDLRLVRETLTGTLSYGGVQVAVATMGYRTESLEAELDQIAAGLKSTQIVLKVVPDVSGKNLAVAQLVEVGIHDVELKGARRAPAELFLMPHVGCNVARLPVRRVLEGRQHAWSMSLCDGRVVHDYLVG